MQTIRFAVVGDLHAGGTAEEVQTTIRLVNQADVDFVLFMGDLADKVLDPDIEGFVGQVKRINKPVYLTIGLFLPISRPRRSPDAWARCPCHAQRGRDARATFAATRACRFR